ASTECRFRPRSRKWWSPTLVHSGSKWEAAASGHLWSRGVVDKSLRILSMERGVISALFCYFSFLPRNGGKVRSHWRNASIAMLSMIMVASASGKADTTTSPKRVLLPIPHYGFDPTEAAIPWKKLVL